MTREGRRNSTLTYSLRIVILLLATTLAVGSIAGLAHAQAPSPERSESIDLETSNWLLISSNRESLKSVDIRGNVSAARLASPVRYPASSFNLTSGFQGQYSIKLTFDYPSEYEVNLLVDEGNGLRKQVASYYFSSGQLLLTISLDFKTPDLIHSGTNTSVWNDFASWTARFGDAFPFWVKLLYAMLAVQFVAVGYRWIRFENERRGENSAPSRFDRGNLFYLWSEILYKFFLTAFIVIAAMMSGQFVLLMALKFMFLAQVNMLSLWDLFVLGFAAGIAAIAYVFRFCLEKSFDLKPLFQD